MIENASEAGRSLSLFPFFPWETSSSREEWLSRKKVFEDGVPSPQHVTKSLASLRGRLISKRFINISQKERMIVFFWDIPLSLIQKLLTLPTKNWKIYFFIQWHRWLRGKKSVSQKESNLWSSCTVITIEFDHVMWERTATEYIQISLTD